MTAYGYYSRKKMECHHCRSLQDARDRAIFTWASFWVGFLAIVFIVTVVAAQVRITQIRCTQARMAR